MGGQFTRPCRDLGTCSMSLMACLTLFTISKQTLLSQKINSSRWQTSRSRNVCIVSLVSRTQFPLLSSSWRWGWSSTLPGIWPGACTASTWVWRTGTPGGRSGAWSAGLICYELCTAWSQHDIQSPEAGKKKNEGIKIFCFVHSLHSHLEPGPGND